jgi:prepilin-type N-terminal cleavage/methylation domain-containing protein
MKKQRGFTIVELMIVIGLVLFVVMAIGWIKNLVKLTNCDFETPLKCEVIHGAGLIPPIGMVTGWLDVGK